MRAGPLRVVVAALVWTAAWACSPEPGPDTSPDPCGVLGTECPYCTDPGAKQTCETAVATSDDVQCTVALDDSQVIADCVVPVDGGDDGATGSEASTLPVCSATLVGPDAGCTCDEPCATTCPTGGCDITCPATAAGGVCAPTCDGGHCTVRCAEGATCTPACAGGGCVFQCLAGSNCASTCAGGGCTTQCADNATCNDICPTSADIPACVTAQ